MAGSYPDSPGHRMAYDRDGSVAAFVGDNGVISQLSETQTRMLNDETNNEVLVVYAWNHAWETHPGWPVIVFPERRDIVAYWVGMLTSGNIDSLQVSLDTTSGADGSWTTLAGGVPFTTTAKPGYRTSVNPITASGVRGIRFHIGNGGLSNHRRLSGFHIYGSITPGEDSDRLRFWHPTLDQEVGGAYFDWGNVPRATAVTRDFRIKNVHPTLKAEGVMVSLEALTEASPTLVSQHNFSNNGLSWGPSTSAGDLLAGQVSGTLTVRRDTSPTAALGLHSARIIAAAAGYT